MKARDYLMDYLSEKFNFHDARINAFNVDIVKKTIVICLSYYRSENDSSRVSGKLLCTGVRELNGLLNLDMLQLNYGPGNVNYWTCYEEKGEAFIYLADGCLSIRSESFSFEEESMESVSTKKED